MSNDLAALQVRLDLQSAAFEKGMRNATKSMGKMQSGVRKTNKSFATMQKSLNSMKAGLAGMAASMLAAFSVRSLKGAIEFGDAIAKQAVVIGVTVEQLQEYRFAAERSGIATANFESSMGQLLKRIGEVNTTGVGTLATGLKGWNDELLVSLQATTSQEQALDLVAEAIKGAATATERAAIANAAFGRSGLAMVGMLKDGKEGLDDLRIAARATGAILSTELTQTAEVLNDRWDTLTNTIGVKFKEALITAADSVSKWFGVFSEAKDVEVRLTAIDRSLKRLRNTQSFYTGKAKEEFEAAYITPLIKEQAQLEQQIKFYLKSKQAREELANVGVHFEKSTTASTVALKAETAALDDMDRAMDLIIGQFNELDAAEARSIAGLDKMAVEGTKSLNGLQVAMGNLASQGISRLVDGIAEGELNFKQFAQSFVREVTVMIAKMIILKALASSIGGPFGALLAGGFAKGGAFENGVQKFASGGIVNQPTLFPTARGMGLMGEAGDEAIMPLTRTRNGDLGVKTEVNVNITNKAGVDVQASQEGNDINIVINKIANDISRGGTAIARSLEGAYGVNRARGVL